MIRVRGVVKTLGGRRVLDGVDLDVGDGQSLVVMGRSGCGKSVLLKHVIGLMKPDRGSIEVDGVEVTALDEAGLVTMRQRFGFVFQGAALFDSMTVGENVGLALAEHARMSRAEIAERVRECLELVGLDHVEHLKPASLSGGMRKRVGLARAIAMHPSIVLYDEPTTGLDPIMADVINELIRSLQRRLGVTSIVVTHDMTSAYKVGDRLAMLHAGKIVFSGTAEETRTTSDPLVRQFIVGSSVGPIEV
jgi:phospholipid/cholesterol/gamma-HCH transport system ATP-binding protein